MKKTKKNSLIIIFLLFVSCVIGCVNVAVALPSLVAYDFNDTAEGYLGQTVHPSTSETLSSCTWQEFIPSVDSYLATITIRVNKMNSPNGFYTMMLQSINASDYPTGTVLAQSTTYLQASLVPANPTSADATFEFNETFHMIAGTKYALVAYVYNASAIDNNNFLDYRYSNIVNGVNTLGTILYRGSFINGGWTRGSAGYSMFFTVTGSSTPYVTPSPTPTAAPIPTTDPSGGIWATLAPYGNIILPLVIILVVAILCGKFGGVWGFLAGLNIAAILIYAVMGATYFPLYGMVLLAVVDGLLLFGKVSGRV